MATLPHTAVSSAMQEWNMNSLHRAAYQLGQGEVVGFSLLRAPGFQQGSHTLPTRD